MSLRSSVRRVSYVLGLRKAPENRSPEKGSLAARGAIPKKRTVKRDVKVRTNTYPRLLRAVEAAWGNSHDALYLASAYAKVNADERGGVFLGRTLNTPKDIMRFKALKNTKSIHKDNLQKLFKELGAQKGVFDKAKAQDIIDKYVITYY